ncbi:MAG: hypothetical protein V4683_01385 [Bacteroidota bacterium]
MKRNIGFFCILLIFSCKAYSQQRPPQHTYSVLKVNTPALDSRIEVASNGDTVLISKYSIQDVNTYSRQFVEKVYKGTPFFKNGWYPGLLYFEDNSDGNGTLAYNLINNIVYFSLGDKSEAVEAKPIGFTISGQTFQKLDKKYQNVNTGYFELIFGDKKVDLFRQYSCVYSAKITGERTGYEQEGGNYEGEYIKMHKLFLGYNENVVELKSNSGIYKQFGDYRNAMEKFGKENKVNPKNEEGKIKLVVYFSYLLGEFEK